MVLSVPGRAPGLPEGRRQLSAHGCSCQAILMQSALLMDSSELRTAVWSCRYVPLFTINTKVKAAAKKAMGTHTHRKKSLKTVLSKLSRESMCPA